MAKTLDFTVANGKGIDGQWGAGNTSGIAYAGAYISSIKGASQGVTSESWHDKRRWVGSDTQHAYTYSAYIKLPKGRNFSITFRLTANNRYHNVSSIRNMLCGYTLTQQTAGSEVSLGYKNNPAGVTIANFTLPAVAQHGSATGTVTINLPDSYSEKKVYFYFWGKDATSVWTAHVFEKLEGTLTYTDYTVVGAPEFLGLETPCKNDKRITLSGDGAKFKIKITPSSAGTNNSVAGYRLYCDTNPISSNSLSYSGLHYVNNGYLELDADDVLFKARGRKIYLGIQAVGSVSGYDSAIVKNDELYVIINSLPTAPEVIYKNSIVPHNKNLTSTIKISSVKATGIVEITDYEYAVSDTSNAKNLNWKPLSEIFNSSSNLYEYNTNNINRYLSFRAYDGLEWGLIKESTLPINSLPTNFGIRSVSAGSYTGPLGKVYIRKAIVDYYNSEKKCEIKYYYDNGIEYLYEPDTQLKAGTGTLRFKIEATNEYGDKAAQIFETNYRYANDLPKITSGRFTLSKGQEIEEKVYYPREFLAYFDLEKSSNDRSYIQKIVTTLVHGNNKILELVFTKNKFDSAITTTHELNISLDKVKTKNLGDCSLIFDLYSTNEANEDILLNSEQHRLSLLPLLTDIINTETPIVELPLLSNEPETIIVNTGTSLSHVTEIQVFVQSPITKKVYQITEYTTLKINENGAFSELTFNNPRKIFQACHLKSDKDYSTYIFFFAKNALDEGKINKEENTLEVIQLEGISNIDYMTSCVKVDFKVLYNDKFVAAPGQANPYILPHIQYSKEGERGNYPNWSLEEINTSQRMINFGEYFYFDNQFTLEPSLKIVYDGSGNDPEIREGSYRYCISCAKIKNDSAEEIWYSSPEWQMLENLEILSFNMPDLNGERIKFKLEVVDEYGQLVQNNSDYHLETDPISKYLIGCRREQPKIIVKDSEIRENGNNLNFSIQLYIEDYGGNNVSYENFNRKIGVLENSKEGRYELFWEAGTTPDKTQAKEEWKRFGTISSLKDTAISLGNLGGLSGRIYLKVTVRFYYNKDNDYIETIAPIYVIYTESPTVSYRYHRLGINASADEKIYEEDVLTISDFQNKRYIRLTGDYIEEETTKTREVIIDLKTGLVTGLVIDCGSWT